MRWRIGNQCKDFRVGEILSRFLTEGQTTRAREFCISCSRWIDECGRRTKSELQKSSFEETKALARRIEELVSREGRI